MNAPFNPLIGSGPIAAIVADCADITGVSITLLKSEARQKPLAQRRHAVFWTARKVLGLNYARIGAAVGQRDHTTVIVAVRRAERLRESEPWFRTLCDELARRAELRRDAAEADRAQLYASQILGPARAIARETGYELALIELVPEQISVIAVPWQSPLSEPHALAEQIRIAAASLLGCAFFRGGADTFPITEKQGRLRWPIQLGGGVMLDLSIFPLTARQAAS